MVIGEQEAASEIQLSASETTIRMKTALERSPLIAVPVSRSINGGRTGSRVSYISFHSKHRDVKDFMYSTCHM